MDGRYLAVVLGCAGLAAGCGSSNTSTAQRATTSGPVSENVFITDVGTLCQSAKTASGGNLDKAATALSQALPQLKAITPPAAHQAAYSKFLARLEALAAAVKNRNSAAVHAEATNVAAGAKELHVPGCAL